LSWEVIVLLISVALMILTDTILIGSQGSHI
jgi:hypothetical protein